ncbi:monovalent cation/H+ antiporter complex subunit F [Anaerotignum sp. MB30-C6]|uniref:monovalent cation/H+ antiporter complex subunit F n=1 Tax=Anaerotignum sp. MB30-C6 TaxID=3070814 RepID=UPI0027DC5940|nr:monovalent cation/H+ antiporter complex subunit F [Anaerotignum sp. MB30-C6]WMI80213.1 monovalent cation/H+ antiporter complex subunit F [Anaerotignum sp. MB30-C6]
MSEGLKLVLEIAVGLLAMGVCIVLIRAIKGPRFTDRIMAINMIGTMTTAMICILSAYLNEVWLIDVALVYTLLSFLAVVIICHVVTLHHKGRELFLKRKEEEAKE